VFPKLSFFPTRSVEIFGSWPGLIYANLPLLWGWIGGCRLGVELQVHGRKHYENRTRISPCWPTRGFYCGRCVLTLNSIFYVCILVLCFDYELRNKRDFSTMLFTFY
jgi:hypothetical protein